MAFTTHENKAFATESLKGKYVLVNFYFTSCHGICPMLTANMRSLLKLIKKQDDLQIISVSVDPVKDTPEVIKAFRSKYAIASDNWVLSAHKTKFSEWRAPPSMPTRSLKTSIATCAIFCTPKTFICSIRKHFCGVSTVRKVWAISVDSLQSSTLCAMSDHKAD